MNFRGAANLPKALGSIGVPLSRVPMTTANRWTPLLQSIADIVGDSAAAALVEHCAGDKIYFPLQPTLIDPLVPVLGVEQWIKLCWLFGGSQVIVPFNARHQRSERNHAICTDRANGMKIRTLAKKYKLGYRTILQILAQQKAAE